MMDFSITAVAVQSGAALAVSAMIGWEIYRTRRDRKAMNDATGVEPPLQPWEGPRETAPAIDWSKPVEYVDGTPLVRAYRKDYPDCYGDYHLVREDGAVFLASSGSATGLIVSRNGKFWLDAEREDAPVLVRNRAEATATEPANENLPPLTVNQCAVLCEMSGDYGHTAATLSRFTGLTTGVVSTVRRELRDMGLAECGPVLDEDTGKPNGSGYWLTEAGTQARERLLDAEARAA